MIEVVEDVRNEFKIKLTDLKLIMDRPNITQEELSNLLNVNIRTIKRHFKELIDNDYIIHDGANKNGCWKINK